MTTIVAYRNLCNAGSLERTRSSADQLDPGDVLNGKMLITVPSRETGRFGHKNKFVQK